MATNVGRHYRRQNLWVTRGEPVPLSGAWVVNPFESGRAVSWGGLHVLMKPTSVNLRHLHWKCEWVVCTVTLERNDKRPETSRSKNINQPIYFILFFPAELCFPIIIRSCTRNLCQSSQMLILSVDLTGTSWEYILNFERTDWVERTNFWNFDKSPANFETPHSNLEKPDQRPHCMTSHGIILLY